MDVLVVGCGLSGIIIAERFANDGKKVTIIDKRHHIGGNVFDFRDEDTGILMNKYGAHLFHTNNEKVWNYINRFDNWVRWDHKVVGNIEGTVFPIPVNINSTNILCNENISNTQEMKKWLSETQRKYEKIQNSEEMGRSRVGDVLYEKIFRDYTFKQWNKYPEELDASVLARIPIRDNFDDRYFNDKYQALPEKGYTHFVSKILEHENIHVLLNTDYFEFDVPPNCIVIYTGPIDAFYSGCGLEKLEYRSIDFHVEKLPDKFYQTNSVVNYPHKDVPYTRIVEYKHFLNQEANGTIIVKETTSDEGEPYYPVPNQKNMDLYEKYKSMAEKETRVHFLGRLANYKYFNMDEAILNALDYYIEHFIV